MPELTDGVDVDRILRENFTNEFRTGYITSKGVCLPEYYRKFSDAIENFQVREDDVWVCSFPKTEYIRFPNLNSESHRNFANRASMPPEAAHQILHNFRHEKTLSARQPPQPSIKMTQSTVYSQFHGGVYECFEGTTWTQEMAWCIANDLNFEAAKVLLSERFPFFDHSILFDYTTIMARTPSLEFPELVLDSISHVDKLPSPRFVKSHLPLNLLPRQIRDRTKKPKIIYVARNAKDTCVSYYNHCKLLEGYRGNFEDFCNLFLADKLCYAPFWQHVLGFWDRKNDDNVLFLKYEDMKADLSSVIRKMAHFLGKSLTIDKANSDDSNFKLLLEHLSFESMKSNPAVNYEDVVEINKRFKIIESDGTFMRSGEKDQWKNQMQREIIEKFDESSCRNLRGSGLSF